MNVHAQMKGQMLIGGEMVAGEAYILYIPQTKPYSAEHAKAGETAFLSVSDI